VDTGSPPDGEMIENALDELGLGLHDIHFVVCTHGHADHIGNNGMFDGATIVVSLNVTKGDLFLAHDWSQPFVLDEGVTVEPAPGHTVGHNVVWVETAEGPVAIAGDTFVREGDEATQDAWLAHSELPEQHLATRERIRRRARLIVPGHGPMFRGGA
jgi:glyoxylase-like metal-dependent hydrolase (beta-lactamase superfamily II)